MLNQNSLLFNLNISPFGDMFIQQYACYSQLNNNHSGNPKAWGGAGKRRLEASKPHDLKASQLSILNVNLKGVRRE